MTPLSWLGPGKIVANVRELAVERAQKIAAQRVRLGEDPQPSDEYIEAVSRRAGEEVLILTSFRGPSSDVYAYLVRAGDGEIMYLPATFIEVEEPG